MKKFKQWQVRVGFLLAGLLFAVFAAAPNVLAAGGYAWADQVSAGTRDWKSVASSGDGSKLAAAVYGGGYIYASTDFGATWTVQTAAGTGSWWGMALNNDGSKLVTASANGDIWTAHNPSLENSTSNSGTSSGGSTAPSGSPMARQ